MATVEENSATLENVNPADLIGGTQDLINNTPDIAPPVDPGIVIFLGMLVIFLLFLAFLCYIFFAICLMKIAKKTETPRRWFAWIPVLNVILMLKIAQKPLWWFFLLLIPPINIAIMIVVWMAIAKAVKKPDWLGVLMLIPIANLIVPAYLAFSKMENGETAKVINPTEPKKEK